MSKEPRRKIVFVIGAGASADFGFPFGEDLANQISAKLDMEFHESRRTALAGPIKTALGVGMKEYDDAVRQLRAGIGPGESIDLFLFRRRADKKVRDLGMIVLSEVILDAERKSPLMQFDTEDFERSLNAQRGTVNCWQAILLDTIIGMRSPDEIDEKIFSNVGFVIFNYDRCIEHLFFHYLHLRHHLAVDRAREIVRSITMPHVYGVLGDLWDDEGLPFGAQSASLASIARELKTYHDELTDVTREQEVRELVDHAEKIVFLGFGFHPSNVKLLFPKQEFRNQQFFGTAKQVMNSAPFSLIKKTDGSKFEDANCSEFIRRFGAEILTAPWKV